MSSTTRSSVDVEEIDRTTTQYLGARVTLLMVILVSSKQDKGNVALDVARILLRPTAELAKTDIAGHALLALEKSSIRKVYLVGRRGPVQAACTAKELREILGMVTGKAWYVPVMPSTKWVRQGVGTALTNVGDFLGVGAVEYGFARIQRFGGIKDLYINIQEADLQKSPVDEEEMRTSRIQKRVYELLCKASSSRPVKPAAGQRELHFVFFQKPDSFWIQRRERAMLLGFASRRQHLKVVSLSTLSKYEVYIVNFMDSGRQVAVGTGAFEDTACGLVLKSIGYKSVPVDGLPFDPRRGVVPNLQGRVLQSTSGDHELLEKGLYVCGWLKRGPTGIIATNLYCAEETVASIMEDLSQGPLVSASNLPKPGREGLLESLDDRKVTVLPFSDWEKIDSEEKRLGSLKDKPREKLSSWQELLNVASD
ncbi:NADPH:adrenodoxin oxidoreductase mitochondrial [Bienertia sinuspersici]